MISEGLRPNLKWIQSSLTLEALGLGQFHLANLSLKMWPSFLLIVIFQYKMKENFLPIESSGKIQVGKDLRRSSSPASCWKSLLHFSYRLKTLKWDLHMQALEQLIDEVTWAYYYLSNAGLLV